MKKNFFLKIFLIIIISTPSTYAQNIFLRPPSLQEVMKQNEEQAILAAEKMANQKAELLPEIPLTYRKEFQGKAIQIFRANEAMLWVQEVDLKKGAKIDSHLEVVSYNDKTGEPQYMKKSITDVLSVYSQKPITLINGQFFAPKIQPSELSFGLKQDDLVRSAGADNRNYAKNILRINGDTAEIVPHSWKNLENSSGNFAMVNFTIDNKRYANENIGRTYVCLKNPNAKNQSSVVVTFVATDATERLVEREMMKWGCTKKSSAQLDGSGSTRLWYNDIFIFGASHKGEADKRKIPHYILFFDGE